MADVGFELLETLSVLSAGRAPVITESFSLSDANGPPPGGSSGVDCEDSIVALVGVILADEPSSNRHIVGLAFTASDHFYVDVAGVGRAGSAVPADIGTALSELASGIAQLPGLTVETDTGLGTITITSTEPVRVTAWSAASGSFPVSGDSTWARFRVWGLPIGSSRWQRLPIEGEPGVLVVGRFTDRNWVERLNVAGLSRLYVELMDSDGTVKGLIAPCVTESG